MKEKITSVAFFRKNNYKCCFGEKHSWKSIAKTCFLPVVQAPLPGQNLKISQHFCHQGRSGTISYRCDFQCNLEHHQSNLSENCNETAAPEPLPQPCKTGPTVSSLSSNWQLQIGSVGAQPASPSLKP